MFSFVAHDLSALLSQGVQSNSFDSIKVCARAPGVSHLLFAYDTLLFSKAERNEALYVKQVINSYARATGQLINPQKCFVQFGDNCPQVVQHEVGQILEVHREEFEGKYLGLPTPDGRMHKDKFQMLQESNSCRILWGETLSQAGKEMMIKAVAQAIPTYIMGAFKLPFSVCDDLNHLVWNFWWGSEQGRGKPTGQ